MASNIWGKPQNCRLDAIFVIESQKKEENEKQTGIKKGLAETKNLICEWQMAS